MWTYRNQNELYHFGVKGMKWGVRRERKPVDLRLAKIRLHNANSINNEALKVHGIVGRVKNTSKSNDFSKMSDQELRERINRLDMEQRYKQLSSRQTTKGSDYAKSILELSGSAIAVTGSIVSIMLGIKTLKGK